MKQQLTEKEELHQKKWDNPNDRNGVVNIESIKDSKKVISTRGVTLIKDRSGQEKFVRSILNRDYDKNDKKSKRFTYRFLKNAQSLFAVDEENIFQVKIKETEDATIVIDSKGYKVNFVDMLFETEKDAKAYVEAPFM